MANIAPELKCSQISRFLVGKRISINLFMIFAIWAHDDQTHLNVTILEILKIRNQILTPVFSSSSKYSFGNDQRWWIWKNLINDYEKNLIMIPRMWENADLWSISTNIKELLLKCWSISTVCVRKHLWHLDCIFIMWDKLNASIV